MRTQEQRIQKLEKQARQSRLLALSMGLGLVATLALGARGDTAAPNLKANSLTIVDEQGREFVRIGRIASNGGSRGAVQLMNGKGKMLANLYESSAGGCELWLSNGDTVAASLGTTKSGGGMLRLGRNVDKNEAVSLLADSRDTGKIRLQERDGNTIFLLEGDDDRDGRLRVATKKGNTRTELWATTEGGFFRVHNTDGTSRKLR